MLTITKTNEKYDYYVRLIHRLISKSGKGNWYEFKLNFGDPEKIGEYLSSLSNEAALHGKKHGYLIWGIADTDHSIVGTDFNPITQKKGNMDLETWLASMLTKGIEMQFIELEIDEKRVVLLSVEAAKIQPTSFAGKESIRNGSHNKSFKDYPAKEAQLWALFAKTGFELLPALSGLELDRIFDLLDITEFHKHLGVTLSNQKDSIVANLINKHILLEDEDGRYTITNVGALLLAKDLDDFPTLMYKKIRIAEYATDTMTSGTGERIFKKGYLPSFDEAIEHVMRFYPREESYSSNFRKEITFFPERAIREALGNMIAHQDLTAPSFGPLISVHPHYIDFSSPGEFEGDTKRAMDMLPSSKNEIMVDLLHLVHICEARGTGIDLMEEWMGLYKLPSPIIQNTNGSTHLILRHYEKLSAWNSIDVINTIYMFASYCYISGKEISNADVRERLNVKEENAAMISRIMKQALDEGLVRIANPNAGAKARKYVPYWA